MKEFMILKQEKPIIDVNFEEVKQDLKERLDDYSKLVVTEDSLSFCKSEQKYLAGLRRKVDTYRKEIKKKMSSPIKDFEDKCKDLITLIEDTEQPIKNGIVFFDNKRRELKKKYAETEMERICNELMLSDKYRNKVKLEQNYLNLTAKETDVSNSIYAQVELLLKEQEQEQQNIELINLEMSKNDTVYELHLQNYVDLLDRLSIVQVLDFIKQDIERLKASENKAKEEVKKKVEEDIKKEVKKKVEEDIKKGVKDDKLTYTLRVTGYKDELELLRKYMDELDISYKKI